MITITRESMKRAIERAKAIHPKVTFVSDRQYRVFSPRSNRTYFVRLEKRGSEKIGYCDCQAGLNHMACFHIAAALPLHIHMAANRAAAL